MDGFKPDFAIDIEWMHRMSHKFERFKVASGSSHVYNCRCPVCGDSEKNSKLARFYFYEKKGQLNVFCHNCDYSHSFWTFMKEVCSNDFDEYKRAQLKNRIEGLREPRSKTKKFKRDASSIQDEKVAQGASGSGLVGVQRILDLGRTHEAVQYLESRGFGDKEMSRLYWAEDFKKTANAVSHEPLAERFPSDPRIIIPFWDESGNLEMLQGRSLSNKGSRYISIKSNPNVDKIYGKYEVDREQTVYCVEGPFDSLFIDNCLATCDSNLMRAPADVYIFDNQCRNKEIVKLMERAIDQGKSIVVWPVSTDDKQDINDLIKLGLTREEIMYIVMTRTFSGLKAKLELNKWRRI